MNGDVVLLLLQLSAFWSVWQWIGTRFVSSGEPVWELVPLISLVVFAWASHPKKNTKLNPAVLIAAAISLVVYAASSTFAPPLVRAVIAMVSLTFVISRWRFGTSFHPAVFTLLLLSLPVMDSVNFFFGFPMRVVVGESTAYLLNLQGLNVYRDGVNLRFGDTMIAIDAPCSGIKTLWFGILLATNLSFVFRLDTRIFVPIIFLASVAILLGNLVRASALFYIEGGLIEAPAWMHSAVGVVAFVFTSLCIAFVVKSGSEVKWRS